MAAVGASISRIPGPPLGPSKRMTTTSPALTWSSRIASRHSSSESKTIAGPVKLRVFTPDTFATAPSGQRFPFKITRCPSLDFGWSIGNMTS